MNSGFQKTPSRENCSQADRRKHFIDLVSVDHIVSTTSVAEA